MKTTLFGVVFLHFNPYKEYSNETYKKTQVSYKFIKIYVAKRLKCVDMSKIQLNLSRIL